MSDLASFSFTNEVGRPEVMDAAQALQRSQEMLADRDLLTAREFVRGALEAFGRSAELLWILAEVEFARGDVVAGRECLIEAMAARPHDSASAARQIRLLRAYGFWRETLCAVHGISADVHDDPIVWAEAGDFYRACGCPAHAASAYGSGRGLRRSALVARRWCWLRSGGPSRLVRRKACAQEETLLEGLRHPSAYTRSIHSVEGLDAGHAQWIQAQLETFEYRYEQQYHE